MSENLYKLAAQRGYRFPSQKGLLTVEQLFQLPLTSVNGASLNSTAQSIYGSITTLGETNFVETAKPDPTKVEQENMLAIVKDVIATKQAENAAALDVTKKKAMKEKLLAALEAKENEKLTQASVDDIKKQIAELGL